METDIRASRGLGERKLFQCKTGTTKFLGTTSQPLWPTISNFPCFCHFFSVSFVLSWSKKLGCDFSVSFVTASKGDREHVGSADMPVQNHSYPLASQFLSFQKQPFWMLTELLFRKSISTGFYTREEGHWSVGRLRKHFSLCVPSKKTYPWSVRLMSWTIIRKWVYLKKWSPKVLSVKMLNKSS